MARLRSSHPAGSQRARSPAAQRGMTTVEVLIVLALIALGSVAAARTLAGAVQGKSEDVGQHVAALTPLDGSGAPPQTAAPAPNPPPPPAPPKHDHGGWGFHLPKWAKTAVDIAVAVSPIGDIQTLLDPNASVTDKLLAGAGLLTSFTPGGAALKGVTGALKVARAARKVDHAIEDGEKIVDAEKAARRAEEAGEPPPRPKGKDEPDEAGAGKKKKDEEKSGNCFAPGTLVHTARGDRAIETLEVGELVWSRDADSGALALKPILRTFVSVAPVIELQLASEAGSESLTVTPEHPFWSDTRGWLGAAELGAGTPLWSSSAAVSGAGTRSLAGMRTVYNLEVQDFHTYFVGRSHVWVHNKCEPKRVKCFERSKKAWDKFSPREDPTRPPPDEATLRGVLRQEEDRQLAAQESELNGMTPSEFLKERQAWKDRLEEAKRAAQESGKKSKPSGRPEGDATARANERKLVEEQLIEHYMQREGLTVEQARAAAKEDLAGTNALHKLDGVAGGDGTMHGQGNGEVNQQIGRQWQGRVDELERYAQQQVDNGLGDQPMNIELKYCD